MAKIGEVQEISIEKLIPYAKNAKLHGSEQVEQIARSIQEFGFISPCLIDRDFNIIAGHGRVMAARHIGMQAVPCVFIEGLTEDQRKAYILADNRLTELGEWVLDLFGGSGTSLIAAEKQHRKCLMMEYDERYAETIIRRWEEMTGGVAEKVG